MVGKSSKIGTFRQASPEAGALSDCATLRHLRAAYGHLIYPAQVVAGANGLGYRGQRFGASPSGKAADFDSAIRRFDPSRPSQLLLEVPNVGLGHIMFAAHAVLLTCRAPRNHACAVTCGAMPGRECVLVRDLQNASGGCRRGAFRGRY